ncbi:MAG TPA: sulfotransferase, partial [Paracoccaceae bacterium]|nr:sulfotransferase [Paracoccaceae bacterium]
MIEWLKRFRPRRAPVDPRTRTLVIGLGAMKSGTSWLSQHLGRHPDFLHSPVKEMNVFNQMADNPFRWRDESYRLFRMEEIVLAERWRRDPKAVDSLRALAQIGRITTPEDYLAYFAERMDRQTHFGEISPAYALLPVETLRLIAGLARDVRFLFLMRDPARRAASHLRHLRRRKRVGVPLDDLLAEVVPGHPVWLRSDYGRTIDLLEAAGVLPQSRLM